LISIILFSSCDSSNRDKIAEKIESSNILIEDSLDNEIKLKMDFNTFDTIVEVIFNNTKDSISEMQKKNYENILSKQAVLTAEILKNIFSFYKRSYSTYKEGWSYMGKISNKELEKYLPIPTTPENLKPFITPAIIHIQNKKDCKIGTFGIEFDCTWDLENGLGVLIEDWKVKDAGLAEVSYFL
jgi:hypothetical protein